MDEAAVVVVGVQAAASHVRPGVGAAAIRALRVAAVTHVLHRAAAATRGLRGEAAIQGRRVGVEVIRNPPAVVAIRSRLVVVATIPVLQAAAALLLVPRRRLPSLRVAAEECRRNRRPSLRPSHPAEADPLPEAALRSFPPRHVPAEAAALVLHNCRRSLVREQGRALVLPREESLRNCLRSPEARTVLRNCLQSPGQGRGLLMAHGHLNCLRNPEA